MAAKRARTPTRQDIFKIPRWAAVAFAARCARRVQPLFKADWKDAQPEHLAAIEKAIALAEAAANGAAKPDVFASEADSSEADAAADAGDSAHAASGRDDDDLPIATNAAYCAYGAYSAAEGDTAEFGLFDDDGPFDDKFTGLDDPDGADVFWGADAAAGCGSLSAELNPAAAAAAWSDYDTLLRLANDERWTNDTPVDASASGPLGPLWPDGKRP